MAATITGIALSNTQLSGTAAAGTEIGTITITLSDGSTFDGSLTLSGPYASYFTITATRDPYALAALSLDNFTLPSSPPAGARVGTLTVTMSDASIFAGTLGVDDTTHFDTSGLDLVTAAALTSGQTYPVTVTASDPGCTNQSLSKAFQIAVQPSAQVPGPLASISSPSQDTSSIQVIWTPPTTGGALDNGVHQIQYKAVASGTWLNATSVPYCTAGKGSITDSYGNVWSVSAANHPVVNGVTDAYSNLSILYLVGTTIWQLDTGGSWWGTTPAARITGAPAWFSGGTTSPLTLTISGLSAGATYNVRGYASNAAGNGTPTAAINVSTATVAPPGSVGPTVSSAFMTIDFGTAFNYPVGTGQQQVSQRMYGVGTSSLGDGGFWAFAQTDIQDAMAQVNPALYMFNHMGSSYWNADRSINTANMANLINNFYKFDPLGVAGVMFAVNWDYIPGGTVATYSDGMVKLATYLNNATMPNGKKFPLVGFIGWDEPDGQNENTNASYYIDMIPKIKAVNPNLLIAGPQGSSCYWTNFGDYVPQLDVFSYNCFPVGCSDTSDIAWNDVNTAITSRLSRWTSDAQAAHAATGGNYKAVMCGGIGMDWNVIADAMNSYVGALWLGTVQITQLNNAKYPTWPCVWAGWDNGTGGMITGTNQSGYYGFSSTTNVTPKGYLMGEGVRKVYGPRWRVTGSYGNMLTCATTPGSNRFGVMVVNYAQGNQSGSVALSKWPVNSTGTGPVRCWQMTAARGMPTGTVTTLQATNGTIPSVSFPNESVTILSV